MKQGGVVLVDRDGVLNRDRADSVLTPNQLEVIPAAMQAVRRLCEAGYAVVVITNQAGIGRGLLTEEGLEEIHEKLKREVSRAGGRLAAIYHCPHHPDAGCACRKPAPGLILQAREDWGFDPARTWMVGDSVKDIEAAETVGCRAVLVKTGKGRESAKERPEAPVFEDLLDFVDSVLAGGQSAPCS